MIRIGQVARPHGIRGALAVNLDAQAARSLPALAHLFVQVPGKTAEKRNLAKVRQGRAQQFVIELEGVTTPEAAESLRDAVLLVEETQLPPLGAWEYWHRDLLGLVAVDAQGARLGVVEEIVDTAEVAVLVVRTEEEERYVPLADPYVLAVELAAGRIVVAPPEVEPEAAS